MSDKQKPELPKIPPLEAAPLPTVPIGNLDAFLDIVGQWNLYDMEVRSVRLGAREADGPAVEVDLSLPDEYLQRPVPGAARTEHRFTIRFTGVSECSVTGFARQNIVGEYEFSAAQHAYSGEPAVRVRIMGTVGCDLDLICESVTIVSAVTLPEQHE